MQSDGNEMVKIYIEKSVIIVVRIYTMKLFAKKSENTLKTINRAIYIKHASTEITRDFKMKKRDLQNKDGCIKSEKNEIGRNLEKLLSKILQ